MPSLRNDYPQILKNPVEYWTKPGKLGASYGTPSISRFPMHETGDTLL